MAQHPGFGEFDKEHREFFNALEPDGWQPVEGYSGVEQKILSGKFDHDAGSGAVTRLSRWAAGAAVGEAVTHDWCEEVFFISGSLSIGTPDNHTETLPAGTYAVRPAHIPHGPFFTEDGCLMIEFLYYPPALPAFADPAVRLATYGTLAPGRPNAHQLADLEGTWCLGHVRGHLVEDGWGAEMGFPGLILDPEGEEVEVHLFECSELPAHWAKLDAFEGDGYRRTPVQVTTPDGDVAAFIYQINR